MPKNKLFPEIVEKGWRCATARATFPTKMRCSTSRIRRPSTWYQGKLPALLKLGVGAIKVDFGEAAPFNGVYASGRTGFYEHNLYPLRYNKAVADITRQVNGENIIWARSAWAGSQRYPLHWGGDAATTDIGMAATLRGGLSFGLSGFTFWSHDIGGFMGRTPDDLYSRWLPFGMLTSHSRSHGLPPREPWEFGEKFTERIPARGRNALSAHAVYLRAGERLVVSRAADGARAVRRVPRDAGSWSVEDEYLFGSDILVAPLFETGTTGRDVYLPPGQWIDYQTGQAYSAGWHRDSGRRHSRRHARSRWRRDSAHRPGTVHRVPGLVEARSGRLRDDRAEGGWLVALPDGELQPLALVRRGSTFVLENPPLAGKVTGPLRGEEGSRRPGRTYPVARLTVWTYSQIRNGFQERIPTCVSYTVRR